MDLNFNVTPAWLLDSLTLTSHCVTTSWLAAAAHTTARIIPVSLGFLRHMPFLPQPSLFLGLRPAQNMLDCMLVARLVAEGQWCSNLCNSPVYRAALPDAQPTLPNSKH